MTGTARREITLFHQSHCQTPERSVPRHRNSSNAAAYHDQVEFLGRQRLKISLHLTPLEAFQPALCRHLSGFHTYFDHR